jgi:hypothetical protein
VLWNKSWIDDADLFVDLMISNQHVLYFWIYHCEWKQSGRVCALCDVFIINGPTRSTQIIKQGFNVRFCCFGFDQAKFLTCMLLQFLKDFSVLVCPGWNKFILMLPLQYVGYSIIVIFLCTFPPEIKVYTDRAMLCFVVHNRIDVYIPLSFGNIRQFPIKYNLVVFSVEFPTLNIQLLQLNPWSSYCTKLYRHCTLST